MIEFLESRIAPAAVFVYTDVDGDHVTIKSSKGTNTELAAAVNLSNSSAATVGKPHTLQDLVLGKPFAGAVISITAHPSNDLNPASHLLSGQGVVNVGEINASTINLASVTVHGDLGQILVGSGVGTQIGLGSLNVQSMGVYGTTTGAASADSRFEGGVTLIKIAHDADGVLLRAFIPIGGGVNATAPIGSVFIGGNLVGGATADTGEIAGASGIKSVIIGGSVIGGTASQTGRIASDKGSLGSIKIFGDLIGSSGQASGAIFSPNGIASVSIGGSIIGGSNTGAGLVTSTNGIKNVSVAGSIDGGSAQSTGGITGASIQSATVGGDLTGTVFSSSSAVDHTAFIRATTNITSVTIGGSIVSGSESGGGALTFSGSIQAGETLGTVKIGGSVQGNSTNEVIISGVGLAAPTRHTQDSAIKSVTVAGTATYLRVMGGYDTAGNAAGGDAQIGSVKIGGDLISSDIIAGVKSTSSSFGNGGDSIIDMPTGATSDGIYATIASITVGGMVEGSVTNTLASFGIEAQLISAMSIGGTKLVLAHGPGNNGFYLGGTTGKEVHVRELGGS